MKVRTPSGRYQEPRSRRDLLRLNPDQFEEFIAILFKYFGYDTHVRGGTGDGGVDIEAYKNGRYTVIQCKQYTGNVGSPVIRDLIGAGLLEKADSAYLFTTGNVSKQAWETARAAGVKIFDSDQILYLVKKAKIQSKSYKRFSLRGLYWTLFPPRPPRRKIPFWKKPQVMKPLFQAFIAFLMLLALIYSFIQQYGLPE